MIFVINCHFEIGSKETFISAIYVNRSKTRFYSFRRVNESYEIFQMDFAPLPGQIDNVKIGAEWSHTSISILINIVGRTIYVDKSTIMPHGVTLPIQINDGKNVIAIK